MVLVLNVLLIDLIDSHSFRAPSVVSSNWSASDRRETSEEEGVPSAQQSNEFSLKPRSVICDMLSSTLPNQQHLPEMTFGHSVTFESVVLFERLSKT